VVASTESCGKRTRRRAQRYHPACVAPKPPLAALRASGCICCCCCCLGALRVRALQPASAWQDARDGCVFGRATVLDSRAVACAPSRPTHGTRHTTHATRVAAPGTCCGCGRLRQVLLLLGCVVKHQQGAGASVTNRARTHSLLPSSHTVTAAVCTRHVCRLVHPATRARAQSTPRSSITWCALCHKSTPPWWSFLQQGRPQTRGPLHHLRPGSSSSSSAAARAARGSPTHHGGPEEPV
jgi:hypothetical protein